MLYESFVLNPYNQPGRGLESIKITKLVSGRANIWQSHTVLLHSKLDNWTATLERG